MDDRLAHFIRTTMRNAGRQYEEARRAYRAERTAQRFDLPTNDEGEARIVCRRHAERRTVAVDAEGRPECFDADHPACQGCVEDVREGIVETW